MARRLDTKCPSYVLSSPKGNFMISMESLRQRLTHVLHLQETPHRTALAFATGVFIAFAPHYLFHTVSAAFCGWMFRLNYAAIFLGSFINNPWTFRERLPHNYSSPFLHNGNMSLNNVRKSNEYPSHVSGSFNPNASASE